MEYVDLAKLTTEQYRSALEDMFATDGWHIFLSELYAISQNINDLQAIGSMEQLFLEKGRLAMIGFILNYEEIMKADKDSNESPE